MMKNLSITLKILSVILFYLVAVFIFTLLSLQTNGNFFQNAIRGDEFRWDYEAMFSAIYFIWAIYLWKISMEPREHIGFIDFTIWANILHSVVMTIVGILRPGEFYHLLGDSLLIGLPAVFLLFFRHKYRITSIS